MKTRCRTLVIKLFTAKYHNFIRYITVPIIKNMKFKINDKLLLFKII